MRLVATAALAAALALPACNQVFGIEQTRALDAAVRLFTTREGSIVNTGCRVDLGFAQAGDPPLPFSTIRR